MKDAGNRQPFWQERIAAQERSGLSVQQFCKEHGLSHPSFYYWRKRLRQQEPVRFALVERNGTAPEVSTEYSIELVLNSGDRLRIGPNVKAVTLRTVLEALRK